MKSFRRGATALALSVLGTGFGGTAMAGQAQPSHGTEIAGKVEALLGRMTIEEKIGQLCQVPGGLFPGARPEETIRGGGAGSVLWLNEPRKFNELQKVAIEESRLGIPVLFALDVIHGYRTIFPIPLGLAASWDPGLVEAVQAVSAREARAAGIHWTFAPMLDIARDARWGRIAEGSGEDPYLASAMAGAHVRGFQGPELGEDRLLACAKHFAGYGAAEGGRDYDPVYLPEGLLRNVYLPPFRAALQAGVGSFMSAYMDLNDVPATANAFLLRDILRAEWRFNGFVVSDAMSVGNLVIQGHARDPKDAALRAFKAGLNMDMASNTYARHLAELVREGTIGESELDDAVRPVLTAKFKLGLFERPYTDESRLDAVLNDPEHRRLAYQAAVRSMVLLRNEGDLLPLRKDLVSLAVIGPLADSKVDTEGSWLVFGHTPSAVTVLEGIRSRVGPGVRVEYAPGPAIRRTIPSFFEALMPGPRPPVQTREEADAAMAQALEVARRCELTVMVMGELANMSGEAASRASLDLPGRQQELLEAVVALGKPVVLVLINGRPLSVNWAAEHVPAILEAWQPGTEGGNAVADVLFGNANPGGKLPVTFPRSGAHSPLYYARNLTHQPESSQLYRSRYWDIPTTPLFPFGFGLSYSSFSYTNLRLSRAEIGVGESVEVSVDLENTGGREGDEVVQLYIHRRYGSDSRPMRELKGFRRLTLAAGEKRTVTLVLGPDELGYWSTNRRSWIQEPAEFDVWVGGDSTASLHTRLKVTP